MMNKKMTKEEKNREGKRTSEEKWLIKRGRMKFK